MERFVKRVLQVLLVAGLFFATSASFAQKTEQHPVLQKFEAEGGKVDFLGHAYGMEGWIVFNPKGGVHYVYTTPDGALLKGMLFAPDGTLETAKQIKAYKERTEGVLASVPGADKSSLKSEKFYAETEQSGWVGLGSTTAPYIYVFINVNCDHCLAFLKEIDSAVTGGKIQVRLVPYGAVEANRDGGAALLSAEHPDIVWPAYLAGDKTVLAKDKIKPEAYLKVDANTKLVKDWKLSGPPFTLYRRPADGVVTAIAGRPENTMLLLSEFLK